MRPQPRYQPGDKIGGRYQVHQALMGGMGEVYLCLDLETIQPYALKTFQQRYLTNPRLRVAFENEVATWVALEKHPNIVRCYMMNILDNQAFMLLEWIAGEEGRGTDLRGWLRRGPLDLRLALDFTIDICRGLVHANEKQPGLVHRDLKPENILVAQGRLAKITDFGLAKIVQAAELEITDAKSETDGRQSLLGQGGIVGTPPYMAPEQWRGESLDARTDIYAVGCILYEMLTGRWPFQATTLDGLRRQHLEADVLELVDGQALPSSLNTLLTRCLAKQREDRFATVDVLLGELSAIYEQQFSEKPKAVAASGEFTAIDFNDRGVTYDRLQYYEQALADFNRAIQLDPNLVEAYVNRGGTYCHLERYEEALADLNYAIQLDSALAMPHVNRGRVYSDLQRYREALADYTRAIQLDPVCAFAFHNRGNVYKKLGQYNQALEDLTRAIQIAPTLAEAYLNRGDLYDRLERYDEALADLNYAIELDPADARAYFDRGNTYRSLLCYDKAIEDYTHAIQLEPSLAEAYGNRGNTYASLQRCEEALADYTHAIQLDPSLAQAYINRGATYRRLQRYDDALADYDSAIQLAPNLAEAYTNRGNIYDSMGRYEEALADHTHSIQLAPNLAQSYLNRGNTYLSLQREDEALADYKHAIELDPTFALAYLKIGALLFTRDALQEALPHFERAASLGISLGKQYAAKIREELGIAPPPQAEGALFGFEALRQASSPKDVQGAITYYEQDLIHHREIGDRQGEWKALVNLGLAYSALGYERQAIGLYEKAIMITRELGDQEGEGIILGNLGSAYASQGWFDEALQHWRASAKILEERGDEINAAGLSMNMAFVLMQQNRLHEALPLAQQATEILGRINSLQAQQAQWLEAQIREMMC